MKVNVRKMDGLKAQVSFQPVSVCVEINVECRMSSTRGALQSGILLDLETDDDVRSRILHHPLISASKAITDLDWVSRSTTFSASNLYEIIIDVEVARH